MITKTTGEQIVRAIEDTIRFCATCGKFDPAHALAWVSTGEGTRHGHHYNDRDRPAGRSLCGRPLPRGVLCFGGIHAWAARNCKACLRAAKAAP